MSLSSQCRDSDLLLRQHYFLLPLPYEIEQKGKTMIKRIDCELNDNKMSAYHDFIEYDTESKEFKVVLNGIGMAFIDSTERLFAIKKMFSELPALENLQKMT